MITTDLGSVTAYAEAVTQGYTGTKEEFGKLLANYTQTAEKVAEDKVAAEQAMESAKESADRASTSEQNAKASENAAAEQAKNVSDNITELVNKKEEALQTIDDKTEESVNAVNKATESIVADREQITKNKADIALLNEDIIGLNKGRMQHINVVTELKIDNTGVIDVTDAINSAIQNVGHSKILYFPTGKYKITDTILLNEDVAIIGDTLLTRQHKVYDAEYVSGTVFIATGSKFVGKAVIDASNWVPDYIGHITIVSDSCLITDPRLSAGADNMSTDGNVVDSFTKEIRYENVIGIHSRGWGSRLEHVRVFGCSEAGFKLEMGDMVDSCMAQSCCIGYDIAVDCLATDLRVNSCDVGYYVRGTANTISNLRADGCHEVGMQIDGGSNNINNCYFDFCNGALVYLHNSSNNTIKNMRGRSGALYAGFSPENVGDGVKYACGLLLEGNCFNNDIDINVSYGNLSDDNSVNTHYGPTFKVVCKSIDSDHRYQSMNNIKLSGTYFNNTYQTFGKPLPLDMLQRVIKICDDVSFGGLVNYMGVSYTMNSVTSAYNGQNIFTEGDYPYSKDISSSWFDPIRAGMIMHDKNSNVDYLSYGSSKEKMLNIQQVVGYDSRINTLEKDNRIVAWNEKKISSKEMFTNVIQVKMNFYGKIVLSAEKQYEIIIDSYTGGNTTEYNMTIYDSSWGGHYIGNITNISTQRFKLTPSFDVKNFSIVANHSNQQSGELTMSITIRELSKNITLKEAVEILIQSGNANEAL